MSRLFWLLLAAARGGYQYLRSILTFCMELRSRAEMAAGNDAAAELAQDAALRAVPGMKPAHVLALAGRAGEIGLSADLVCWIVNDVVFRWVAVVELAAAPATGTGIPGAAVLLHRIPLTADAENGLPVPMAFRRTDGIWLAAAAETGLPMPVAGECALHMELEAPAVSAPDVPAAGNLTAVLPGLMARAGSGAPDPTAAGAASGLELAAKMMCWSAPEWVDGNTLYIRQVYSATRDGDALILQ